VSLVHQGVTYTTREKVLDIKEKENSIPIPPVLGGIALVGGITLVAVGARRG
jgi:hypothetical protein